MPIVNACFPPMKTERAAALHQSLTVACLGVEQPLHLEDGVEHVVGVDLGPEVACGKGKTRERWRHIEEKGWKDAI